jgi:hypothetical protein
MLQNSDQKKTAMVRLSSNCKSQTPPLIKECSPQLYEDNFKQNEKKNGHTPNQMVA